MESNNRERIKTMLNKEIGDVWNDFFVGEIFKSFLNIPKTEDIAMEIMEWIKRKVKDWSENHVEN